MFNDVDGGTKFYNFSEELIVSKLIIDLETVRMSKDNLGLAWNGGDASRSAGGMVFYSVNLEDDIYLMVWVDDERVRLFLDKEFEIDSLRRMWFGRYIEEQYFQRSLIKEAPCDFETYNAFIQFADKINRILDGVQE